MQTFIPIPTRTQCTHENKQNKYYLQEPDVLDLWGGGQAEVETINRNVIICAFSINATREACV
jgi:hypothetical protein